MKLFRRPDALPQPLRGGAVAMGNFDGMHPGHAAVIARARAWAADAGAPFGVLTFEPHPRELFRPGDPPFRLMDLRARIEALAAERPDFVVVLRFDRALADLTAEAFVDQALASGIGLRRLVVGWDFCCGRGRAGTVPVLRELGAARGFTVDPVTPVADPDGAVYSSSLARQAIRAGRIAAAAALLGRPWTLAGRVRHGDARGRTIGFPTANLRLGRQLRPPAGVYAVRARWRDGGRVVERAGVANLGVRPTVGGGEARLEAHLFDFAGDLYGRRLIVEPVAHLRPEMRFADFAALRAQIAADAEAARRALAA